MTIILIIFRYKDWGYQLKIKEKNFHTGHSVNIPITIDDRFISNNRLVVTSPIISNLINKFFKNNDYSEVNPQLCLLGIASTIEVLNKRIINVQNRFNDIQYRLKTYVPLNPVSPQEFIDFNIELEQIIHIIKRIVDELIIMFCITHDINNINITNKIQIRSIGDLNKDNQLTENIKISINYKNFEPFLSAINELHNAYKHDIQNIQSRTIVGINELTAHALYSPYGNLNNLIYINCSFAQIIAGFNEFLLDITDIEKFSGKHIYEYTEQLSLLKHT